MHQATASSRAAAGPRLGLPEGGWALIAGVMLTTALPPFHRTGPLVVPALALLLGVLLAAERPARTGWLFGVGHAATLLYWMFLLVPAAAIPSRWLVAPMAVATILYVSIFYLGFGWVVGRVRLWRGPEAALLLAPAAWTGMEALRGMGELGFPWCLSGSAWLDTPLQPLAAAVGELGLSAATALTAALLVAGVQAARRDPAARRRTAPLLLGATALAWAGLVAGAAWRAPAAAAPPDAGRAVAVLATDGATTAADVAAGRQVPPPPPGWLRVAAVQADVALADKWKRARIDSTRHPYARLTGLAARLDAELVVWAETAVPAYLLYDADLLAWVRGLAAGDSVYLYTGFPDATIGPDGERLIYNSSGLFDPHGRLLDRYAKHHLLAIGERIPFSRYLPVLGRIQLGQAEWEPGEPPGPIELRGSAAGVRFAGLICFESIFSGLSRGAVRRGANLLINITNDGWFGPSAGPRQHADLARLRAIECAVPLVRCANNGISFVCGADGEPVSEAPLQERGLVVADLVPGPGGTLFVRVGGWPVAAFLGLWVVVALIAAPAEEGAGPRRGRRRSGRNAGAAP